MSITSGGQVVRSPINADFRETGRSTMGVKFVTPKDGDSVAVVARSVETAVEDAVDEAVDEDADGDGRRRLAQDGTAPDVPTDGARRERLLPTRPPDATIEDGSPHPRRSLMAERRVGERGRSLPRAAG